MKKLLLFILLLQAVLNIAAQEKNKIPDVSNGEYTFIGLEGDTVTYRDKASYELRKLREGSLIVRLKTSSKNIEAYRKAGRDDVADRIEQDRLLQNQRMYKAFSSEFVFCKVYFIYSSDTRNFLDGKKGIFLNQHLEYDPGIVCTDTNFVFCEYGSAESYSKFTDQSGLPVTQPAISGGQYSGAGAHTIVDTVTRSTSTGPASTAVLFFSDKNLDQLHRPFPMSDAIYFNNFSGVVSTLNRQVERAYYNLVAARDAKQKRKDLRKKQKEASRKKK